MQSGNWRYVTLCLRAMLAIRVSYLVIIITLHTSEVAKQGITLVLSVDKRVHAITEKLPTDQKFIM